VGAAHGREVGRSPSLLHELPIELEIRLSQIAHWSPQRSRGQSTGGARNAPQCLASHHMSARSRSEMALFLLESLRGHDTRDALDDYDHSLQTATRAERAGADPHLVVAALLHDAGKAVTFRRHDRVAAEMLAGAVRPEVVWMVGVHEEFTSLHRTNGRA